MYCVYCIFGLVDEQYDTITLEVIQSCENGINKNRWCERKESSLGSQESKSTPQLPRLLGIIR